MHSMNKLANASEIAAEETAHDLASAKPLQFTIQVGKGVL